METIQVGEPLYRYSHRFLQKLFPPTQSLFFGSPEYAQWIWYDLVDCSSFKFFEFCEMCFFQVPKFAYRKDLPYPTYNFNNKLNLMPKSQSGKKQRKCVPYSSPAARVSFNAFSLVPRLNGKLFP